jgi:AraC-like DNA-binding protein
MPEVMTAEGRSGLSVALWTSVLSETAICARQRYFIAAVRCDVPVLILPLQGNKNVIHGGHVLSAGVGEYVMIHRAMDVSMENIPALDGPYVAGVLNFPWRLVGLARQIVLDGTGLAREKIDKSSVSCNTVSEHLLAALRHYLDLVRCCASPAQIDHALVGILVALHADGASGFVIADDPSLSARIRLIVSAQPQREWASADFEEMFHMSGATLRRRLADENANLRSLVREARLQYGLGLLQTTQKTVAKVAEQCGYRSVSSFREGFIEQFGVDPAAVAND